MKYRSKIIANDIEGLQIIAAYCAGAEVLVSDIKYLQSNKVFLISLERFKVESKNEDKKSNSIFISVKWIYREYKLFKWFTPNKPNK